VLRALAARDPLRYPLLLESAATGPLSRASVLLAEPGAALWLDADGRLGAHGLTPAGAGFLTALENWWLAERHLPGAADAAALHSRRKSCMRRLSLMKRRKSGWMARANSMSHSLRWKKSSASSDQ